MFEFLEIIAGAVAFLLYKNASGWYTAAPEEHEKSKYPELNEDLVQRYLATLNMRGIDAATVAATENELKDRGFPDPRETFWPQNGDPQLYLARLFAAVEMIKHQKKESRPPQTNQSWRGQRMKAAYDPVYDRPREPQEGLNG